jgi:hypothetical protein
VRIFAWGIENELIPASMRIGREDVLHSGNHRRAAKLPPRESARSVGALFWLAGRLAPLLPPAGPHRPPRWSDQRYGRGIDAPGGGKPEGLLATP